MQPQDMLENFDFCHNYLARNEASGQMNMGDYGFDNISAIKSFCSSSLYPSEYQEAVESSTPEARAIAASNNHKEAERRRRERINSHLNRLRTLLSCNSKTDKASLLAKVVQRVRELKEETSQIMQFETNFPSESDEITVLTNDHLADGRLIIKASLCCEDRFDLIPDLIETLKPLGLSPIRAEMVTLGGRIRNVILLAADNKSDDESLLLLRDALGSIIQRSSYGTGERPKRRRVLHHGTENY